MTNQAVTLMVLVDAMRADYLREMPYLQRLAHTSATGSLRECFGFVPRQAYFGGLSIEDYGFTNMYCFDPVQSPFSAARYWPGKKLKGGAARYAREAVENSARDRLTGFARAYATSVEIPLPFLPYFDLVERRAPWDPKVGYTSCFHILDRQRIEWLQCMWPETNLLPDRSDAGIARHVLATVKDSHRLVCVHLQELDGLGHLFGPHAPELRNAVRATDRLCEELIEGLKGRFGAVNVLLFGDHGMVNVTRTLDVSAPLAQTGLNFGTDFGYFIDSTMVRFWWYHQMAREKARHVFTQLQGGRWLSGEEKSLLGIAGCDRRNGEDIFLADPGVLIFPNFFQSHGEPIKGMHGYDPDCVDNLGYFLLHDTRRPEIAGCDLGKVDPPSVFPTLLSLLGVDPTAHTRVAVPQVGCCDVNQRRFVSSPDSEAEQMVASQLEQIVQRVQEVIGRDASIILTGSFGRGEGGVYRDDSGAWRPVNDYDLIVTDRVNRTAELAGLGGRLASDLGIDFVDLGYMDCQWSSLPLTVFSYDLKYGSQVLAGDKDLLQKLPLFSSADLPAYEAVKLLLNRTAGLLSALNAEAVERKAFSPEARRYFINQLVKYFLAIGDSYLLRWQGYDASYRTRGERFAALAPGAGVPSPLRECVRLAHRFKLSPNYELFPDLWAALEIAVDTLPNELHRWLESFNELKSRSLSQGLDQYVEGWSSDPGAVATEYSQALASAEAARVLNLSAKPSFSLRHAVFAAIPDLFLFLSRASANQHYGEARRRLTPLLSEVPGEAPTYQNWEHARSAVITAWFALCH